MLFLPNEVTPAITVDEPMKFGPPESPEHVPPVWALFERISELSPVGPVLIEISFGVETMRVLSALFLYAVASGKLFCRPYPTAVNVAFFLPLLVKASS